jgi:hypothetical protein
MMILLRIGLLTLKGLILNKNNINFQISIYSFGMEISRFISRGKSSAETSCCWGFTETRLEYENILHLG